MQQQHGCQHFVCAKNKNVKYPLCPKTLVYLHAVANPGNETAIQLFCKTVMPSFVKMGKTVVIKYFLEMRSNQKTKCIQAILYITPTFIFTYNANHDKTLSSIVPKFGQ